MMVVKPENLAPVDKRAVDDAVGVLPRQARRRAPTGQDGRREAGRDRVQRLREPVQDGADQRQRGERIRMYVLNAGPSKWSAFHVIGTVFDRTVIEGTVGHDSQTVNLAPSQGGWVEFTLAQEGNFPFVTHSFGDMVSGAAGILHTTSARGAEAHGSRPGRAPPKGVGVTLGEMWVKTDDPVGQGRQGRPSTSPTRARRCTSSRSAPPADDGRRDPAEPRRDRQGRDAAHGRQRDRHRRPQARQVRPLLPRWAATTPPVSSMEFTVSR